MENLYCDLASEGAQAGLFALMTGISEEFWCAGWMSGLEYDLWGAPASKRYGQGEITERLSTLLRLLAEEADGWWIWEDTNGAKFISLKEWHKRLGEENERADATES